MPEKRRRFSAQFKAKAVQMVIETGKPIAEVARDLGIRDGTLGNWTTRQHPHPLPQRPAQPAPHLRTPRLPRRLPGHPPRGLRSPLPTPTSLPSPRSPEIDCRQAHQHHHYRGPRPTLPATSLRRNAPTAQPHLPTRQPSQRIKPTTSTPKSLYVADSPAVGRGIRWQQRSAHRRSNVAGADGPAGEPSPVPRSAMWLAVVRAALPWDDAEECSAVWRYALAVVALLRAPAD
jgi:hypothetical protein